MRTLRLRLRAAAGGPGRFSTAWVTLTGTGAAASVAFGLLVFASVLASLAIPRESVGLSNGALHRVIAASRLADRTVIGTVPETSLTDEVGQVQATDIASVGASLRARLAAGGLVVASNPPAWASLTTEYVPVSGAAKVAGNGQPQFEMTYRTELAHYSQLVAGRLPVGGSEPGKVAVIQAAVSTATAARFGLQVGARLTAGSIQLVVTGIIRPTNPAATFWSEDPVAARPALTQAAAPQLPYWIGAVFVGPGAPPLVEANIGNIEMQVTWVYTAALGGLSAGQADGLEASVTSLVTSGATVTARTGSPATVTISSQIPAILSPFVAGESAVAPALELLYVSLAIIGAVVVLLGARLVAQRRAAEFTLMRARGAALYQLGWLVLRASLVIAAAAGAVAALLALGLTPGDGDAVGWWLAGLTIAVTVAGPVLISVVPQRVASPATGRPERQAAGRRPAARRIIVEVVLFAVSIGGLVVLRNEGPSSGNNGLYAGAAPVLVAIPVAVVLLRLYPLLARELARIAGLTRGVVAFVGLTRATRTPPGTVLPAFALVLVLAMVAFPAMVSTAVTRSQVAARQNVLLPMRLSSLGRREQRRRAGLLLDTLGITHCADRTPDRMSGGEQQRAAIATALANQPKVLLADEPTGELDSATARDVFAALQTANTDLGATVLVVTHDSAVSSQVRRTIAMRDGKTSSETIRHSATDEQGQTTLHAREYATLDRAGRVQLPRAMTRRLGIRNRVELQEEPDHIAVWPDQSPDQERE